MKKIEESYKISAENFQILSTKGEIGKEELEKSLAELEEGRRQYNKELNLPIIFIVCMGLVGVLVLVILWCFEKITK